MKWRPSDRQCTLAVHSTNSGRSHPWLWLGASYYYHPGMRFMIADAFCCWRHPFSAHSDKHTPSLPVEMIIFGAKNFYIYSWHVNRGGWVVIPASSALKPFIAEEQDEQQPDNFVNARWKGCVFVCLWGWWVSWLLLLSGGISSFNLQVCSREDSKVCFGELFDKLVQTFGDCRGNKLVMLGVLYYWWIVGEIISYKIL